jgi:demethylspheroidene O-methyltransferase
MRDRWNALVATDEFQRWSARFPLTRPITMYRSRKVFDIVSGFVYTQTLLACVELDLFEFLADGAKTTDEIATHAGLSRPSTERLINAAVSLRLLMKRRHGRFAVGPLGAPLVHNAGLLALIRHHRMAYHDLADPVSLLRQGADYRTALLVVRRRAASAGHRRRPGGGLLRDHGGDAAARGARRARRLRPVEA